MHTTCLNNLIAAASTDKPPPAAEVANAAQPALLAVATIGVGILVVGMLLCLYRMIRGPHLADRVLAGDTMAMLVAGLVVVLAVKYSTSMFYDAALVVAILGFASTVAFSQYMGAKHKTSDRPDPADTAEVGP
ncbi:MAG: monovalent cation/H+ antiporter complex subunit F [Planctomycetota bacterium]